MQIRIAAGERCAAGCQTSGSTVVVPGAAPSCAPAELCWNAMQGAAAWSPPSQSLQAPPCRHCVPLRASATAHAAPSVWERTRRGMCRFLLLPVLLGMQRVLLVLLSGSSLPCNVPLLAPPAPPGASQPSSVDLAMVAPKLHVRRQLQGMLGCDTEHAGARRQVSARHGRWSSWLLRSSGCTH